MKLAVSLLAAALATAAGAQAAERPAYVVRSDRSVAGVPMSASIARATRVLGKPDRITGRNTYEGVLTWKRHGLVATFFTFADAPCANDTLLSATMTGNRWRTWLGLRIGDRAAAVRRTHRKATRHGSSWWLVTRKACELGNYTPYPALLARVKNGRVRTLVFSGSVCE